MTLPLGQSESTRADKAALGPLRKCIFLHSLFHFGAWQMSTCRLTGVPFRLSNRWWDTLHGLSGALRLAIARGRVGVIHAGVHHG